MIFKRFETVKAVLYSNKIYDKSGFPIFLRAYLSETTFDFLISMYDLADNHYNTTIHSIAVFDKDLYLFRFKDKLNTVKCQLK